MMEREHPVFSVDSATERMSSFTTLRVVLPRRRSALRVLVSLALMVPAVTAIIGAGASEPAGAAPPNSSFEVQITANANNSVMGEPEIAQDPTNPSHLYQDWTTFSSPPGGSVPGVTFPCGGALSTDRGQTWQPAPVPMTRCADGIAAYTNDGTLLAGGIVTTSTQFFPPAPPPNPPCPPNERFVFGLCLLAQGYDAIMRSTDGGHSWSAEVPIMGSTTGTPYTFPFAPGSGHPADTFDRPWLAVDRSTGVVYAASHNIVDHEMFVTESKDGGTSFGTIYAVDTTYPSVISPGNGLPSGTMAAANGELAVAYTAAAVPGRTCPCVIFETSSNGGASFTPHIVSVTAAASVPRPFLAANPATPGRFALTIFDSTGTENQVYTTSDNGDTWQGPAVVGEAPANTRFKPWLTFGPSGLLALVWRTQNPDGSYDIWAATGRVKGANGADFAPPLRVSSQSGTYPPSGGQGDDFSWVIADNQFLHIGWGDSRNEPAQGVQVWYSRIPTTAFNGH
jgi:hypothetical protein